MLQNIRDKMQGQKWLTYSMLGALALVFAAWGAAGIVDFGFGNNSYAVKVGGDSISAEEMNRTWQQRQPQLLQAFGGNLSDAQRAEFQQSLLNTAARSLVTQQHARKLGFRVSDEQVKAQFASEPAFQIDGKFNAQAALSRLVQAGLTPEEYERDLRRDLLTNRLVATIGATDFLTPAESKRILGLLDEERELRYVIVQPDAFVGTQAVEPAAVEAYYKAHGEEFTLPETVRLSYAELTLADVAASLAISDEQLHARYDQNKASYVQPETRHAAHILIAVDGDTTDAKAAALAKDLYARIQGGGDFAALAKQYSKDTASAEKGGDLDWAARETYVKEFGDQLFTMKEGQVSQPVKTQFGYHIIRLDGIRAPAGRSFEDVKAELAASMRNEQAITQFGSRQDQLQGRLERAGASLDQLVKEFSLRTGEVAQFERGAGGLPLGSDVELNRAVFSEAALAQRRVGGPIQLGEDRVVIFQAQDHQPPKLKPLDEVRAGIVSTLQREQGSKAALAAAEDAVTKLKAGQTLDQLATALKIKAGPALFVSRSSPDLPAEIRDATFAAARPVPGKPWHQALKMEGGAVAVLEVSGSRVQALSDNLQLQRMRSERELQRYSQREIEAYVASLVKDAKVRVNPQVFQQ